MQRNFRQFVLYSVIGAVFVLPITVNAAPNRAPEVQVVDMKTREVQAKFMAFEEGYVGGIKAQVGDFGGDGVNEYVVVQSGGESAEGVIRSFRKDGSKLGEARTLKKEATDVQLDVALGDVDGDGKDEIIVSRMDGDSSKIQIYNGNLDQDISTAGQITAFPEFEAGATVTVGNIIGDERDEIIVATSTGAFPLIRIFNEQGVMVAPDISPFSESDTHGLNVAVVNTGGGEYGDIVVGYMNGGQTMVKNYRIDNNRDYPILGEFRAWPVEFDSGVEISGVDLNQDGTEEIALAPAGDQRGEIKFFRGDGEPHDAEAIFPYEELFRGGIHHDFANVDNDKQAEVIVSPGQQRHRGDPVRGEKYIEVNLSEQSEYVWENGYLLAAYRVSTGLWGTPTPPGDYSVLKKLPTQVYDGRPDYYYPNTPWNLRFIAGPAGGNYYLHTAYWHNNFGNRMSHGCVNMKEADAKFIYFWADIGTSVWVHN